MKKRILALAMAAVMAGSLTACSGSSGTDTKAAPAETEAPATLLRHAIGRASCLNRGCRKHSLIQGRIRRL